MAHISDSLEATPPDSLLVGVETTVDGRGKEWSYALIHGTPIGFRMLAQVLIDMADSVEAGDSDAGWHLALAPEDFPALRTLNARNLDLTCIPTNRNLMPDKQ